jgi:hypothetical protein
MDTGLDDGYLSENIFEKPILLVKYDLQGNIVTTSLDSKICVIDRGLNKKYITTRSPVISFVQSSKGGNYMFTGRKDMKVTVWFKNWTRLCELTSSVNPDRLYLSKSNDVLFAIPKEQSGFV